jgi:hypothetical protein
MGIRSSSANRMAIILALVSALFGAGGCEGLALVGRESLKLEPAEVVAEVERVDRRSKQIYVKPNSAGIGVVAYGDDTRVIYRGRELPAEDLQAGDVIAMTVKEDSSGYPRSDFLTIRERREDRDMTR